jgi:hypothetical protein
MAHPIGGSKVRYSLWSRGRLVGHTDLDIPTVTPTMRQGFVEPGPEGRAILADASGVWRAIAEMKRTSRARGDQPAVNDHSLVTVAANRREALHLELRDENGALFQCEFIRITDLFDIAGGMVDEMSDTEEEEEAAFEVELSALFCEARDRAIAERAQMNARVQADIEAIVADMVEEEKQNECGSAWPPRPPEDSRWETMQYLLQVHLAIYGGEVDASP